MEVDRTGEREGAKRSLSEKIGSLVRPNSQTYLGVRGPLLSSGSVERGPRSLVVELEAVLDGAEGRR